MKVLLLFAFLLALPTAQAESKPAPVPAAAPLSVTFQIPTMACAACAGKIKAALKAQPGLTLNAINLKEKRAVVTLDPTKTDRATVAAALAAAGFPASPP